MQQFKFYKSVHAQEYKFAGATGVCPHPVSGVGVRVGLGLRLGLRLGLGPENTG